MGTINIDLTQPANGTDIGSWDVPVNGNFGVIDQALGTISAQGFTDVNITLTVDQSAYYLFNATGTLTGNVQLIFPATIGGVRYVANNCTGAFTLTVLNGAGDTGGGIIIGQGVIVPILLTAGQAYQGNVQGSILGSSPAVSSIGAIVTASGGGTTLVSGTAKTILTISLTAGNWLVYGSIAFNVVGGVSVSSLVASVSPTTNTVQSYSNALATSFTVGTAQNLSAPPNYVSLSSPASYYLVARSQFNISNGVGASGIITAIRQA